MTYARRVIVAVDQILNAILNGWPDETLSSRAWRWELDGIRSWPRKWIDGFFFWETDHCRESYESERTGRQLPPELR